VKLDGFRIHRVLSAGDVTLLEVVVAASDIGITLVIDEVEGARDSLGAPQDAIIVIDYRKKLVAHGSTASGATAIALRCVGAPWPSRPDEQITSPDLGDGAAWMSNPDAA
jgi:hypothetical protein